MLFEILLFLCLGILFGICTGEFYLEFAQASEFQNLAFSTLISLINTLSIPELKGGFS